MPYILEGKTAIKVEYPEYREWAVRLCDGGYETTAYNTSVFSTVAITKGRGGKHSLQPIITIFAFYIGDKYPPFLSFMGRCEDKVVGRYNTWEEAEMGHWRLVERQINGEDIPLMEDSEDAE